MAGGSTARCIELPVGRESRYYRLTLIAWNQRFGYPMGPSRCICTFMKELPRPWRWSRTGKTVFMPNRHFQTTIFAAGRPPEWYRRECQIDRGGIESPH